MGPISVPVNPIYLLVRYQAIFGIPSTPPERIKRAAEPVSVSVCRRSRVGGGIFSLMSLREGVFWGIWWRQRQRNL
jgi:hypothetical protein